MTRNHAALGLVLLAAVLSVGATLAPAAQADPTFTATEYPATLTGQIEGVFESAFKGGTLKCEAGTFHGEASKASSTITFEPAYAKCKLAGLAATVSPNGCHYTFHVESTVEAPHKYSGSASITCPASKAIEIKDASGLCTVKIGTQSGLKSINFENMTNEPEDVTVNTSLKTLKYTSTKNNMLCALTQGTFEDGTAIGLMTVIGEEPKGEKRIGVLIDD